MAIIHVEERDFLLEPIVLQTVRPFVMDDIDLDDAIAAANVQIDEKLAVIKLLKQKVHGLIKRADLEWKEKYASLPEADKPEKMLPLVRLRVAYTRHEIGNLIRFGQDFTGKVANPRDLLQFHKKKASQAVKKNQNLKENYVEPTDEMLPAEKLEKVHMSDLVQKYLASQQLQILNPTGLERAVMNFVDKDDRDAIGHFVEKEMKTTNTGLVAINPDESKLQAELDKIREEKMRLDLNDRGDEEEEDEAASTRKAASTSKTPSRRSQVDSDDSMLEDMDEDDDGFEERQPPARQSRATPSTSKATSSRAPASQKSNGSRMTQSTLLFNTNSDDESIVEESPRKPTNSRAAALSAIGSTSSKKKPATAAKKAPAPAPSRATGGRTAARRASTRLVESQAEDEGEEEESFIVSDDSADDFEATSKKTTGRGKVATKGRR